MHFAVFLWGFTAILGKLISISALHLVFWRMTIAASLYLMIPSVWKRLKLIPGTIILKALGIGLVISLHWLSFYYSIQVGQSASLTLSCLGTGVLFVIWLDRLMGVTSRISRVAWLVTFFSILGMYFVSQGRNEISLGKSYQWAILLGIMASGLAAIFSVLNKQMLSQIDPLTLSALEMASGSMFSGLILVVIGDLKEVLQVSHMDWLWIIILSLFCTNVPFLLSIQALRKISTLNATVAVNLEPIYGYVLAAYFFDEFRDLNHYFYLGAFILILTVFLMAFGEVRPKKQKV
ncbi:MAG: DMT family transporter [Chitinophagales bacterium]|nr:DMT family transporter [Chitinophagales bacterium]